MSNSDPNKIAPRGNESRSLVVLSAIALVAWFVGAAGSLIFMFRAGQHTPRLLLILFTIWILIPFGILLWAHTVSERWPIPMRATLYWVTLIVALSSLAIYGEWIDVKPAGSANAFLFVAVPPISLLFILIVLLLSRFISRRSPRG